MMIKNPKLHRMTYHSPTTTSGFLVVAVYSPLYSSLLNILKWSHPTSLSATAAVEHFFPSRIGPNLPAEKTSTELRESLSYSFPTALKVSKSYFTLVINLIRSEIKRGHSLWKWAEAYVILWHSLCFFFFLHLSPFQLTIPVSNWRVSCCSVAESCPALCDPMDSSMPGFPVLHYLLEFAQAHVHWVSDVIQLSHPPSSPSPLALNLSQNQGLFQWIGFLHLVPKVLDGFTGFNVFASILWTNV